MIQIHIASAVQYDRAEVVLNWKERGTIESENSSGYEKSEKQVGNNTKIPSCWSLFTMAGTERSSAFIRHHNEHTHTHTGQFSLAHCRFDTFLKSQWKEEKQQKKKNKWGWECDGACTLSLSLHGGVCVCEGSLKQFYTRRLILSERRRPVQILQCADIRKKSADSVDRAFWGPHHHHHHHHINKQVETRAAERRLTLCPLTMCYKNLSLSALPSVGSECILQARSVPL